MTNILPKELQNVTFPGACQSNSIVYMFGGYNGNNYLNDLWCFNGLYNLYIY